MYHPFFQAHVCITYSLRSSSNFVSSLAYLEVNMTIAVMFGPGAPRLELFETDESDIVQEHDFLIPVPKLNSKGLRVKVV